MARIEPLLPRRRKGAQRIDDGRDISGILHMLKSSARRRDCPPEYGSTTISATTSLADDAFRVAPRFGRRAAVRAVILDRVLCLGVLTLADAVALVLFGIPTYR